MAKLTVGVPVYNGEDFLDDALRALRDSDVDGMEIVVSDNASTDATAEIAKTHATEDDRVRVLREDTNKGAAWNFNRLLDGVDSPYFKWAAHDDVVGDGYLRACVEALDEDPGVVLAHTAAEVVDPRGRVIDADDDTLGADAQRPSERFAGVVLHHHSCLQVFGVIRTDVLRRTPAIGAYVSSDRVLLAELALHGRFHQDPRRLFKSREHSGRSIRALPRHLRLAWFDAGSTRRIALPNWRLAAEYTKAIRRVPLSSAERAATMAHLARWTGSHAVPLAKDVVRFGVIIAGRTVDDAKKGLGRA